MAEQLLKNLNTVFYKTDNPKDLIPKTATGIYKIYTEKTGDSSIKKSPFYKFLEEDLNIKMKKINTRYYVGIRVRLETDTGDSIKLPEPEIIPQEIPQAIPEPSVEIITKEMDTINLIEHVNNKMTPQELYKSIQEKYQKEIDELTLQFQNKLTSIHTKINKEFTQELIQK